MITLKQRPTPPSPTYNDIPVGTLFVQKNNAHISQKTVFMKACPHVGGSGERLGKPITALNLSSATNSIISPEDYGEIELVSLKDLQETGLF